MRFWIIKMIIGMAMISWSWVLASQETYPTDYFISPVDHTLRLSGSFGELRSNHFHLGIDIKSSNGRSGDKVYACADGYISRIAVSAGGYGNAIYLNHPNGYTTVYCHLQKFSAPISEMIRQYQYDNETFEVNMLPDSAQIYIKQGEIIGFLGNSGRSFGPHLHFEIRETATDTPINPMLFGMKPNDTRPPTLKTLRVNGLSSKLESLKSTDYSIVGKNGKYSISADTVFVSAQKVRLSIEMHDKMNGSSNKNGVYRCQLYANDLKLLDAITHKISFDETGYINEFMDYQEYNKTKRLFTNLFRTKNNPLKIYNPNIPQLEYIHLDTNEEKRIQIELSDIEKNKTTLSFVLAHQLGKEETSLSLDNYILSPDKDQYIISDQWYFKFNQRCFLDSSSFRLTAHSDTLLHNNRFKIGHTLEPVYNKIDVYRYDINIDSSIIDKVCLVDCSDDELSTYGGEFQDSTFHAEVFSFGQYEIYVDTIPPTIQNINLKKSMVGQTKIKFKVTDNLKPGRKKYNLKYKAWIDDHWVLFEYDQKNDLLTHHIDPKLTKGTHSLVLEVQDAQRNITRQVREFVY